MNIYQQNGYANRHEYFESLAAQYGVGINTVNQIAFVLGHSNDFNGLIKSLDVATQQ